MNILLPALRGAIQSWWGGVAAWLLSLGVTIPDETSGVIVTALVSMVIGLTIAGLRWLESRTGDSWWERAARRVGKLLMVGLSGSQPTYQVDPKARNGTR